MANHGQIITFYSYKGGVGRTMLLANIAWLLASNGMRVLTIDWDLEAPGLPRFFHPFVDDSVLASSPGLIDLFADYVEGASVPGRALPSIAGVRSERPVTDVLNYIISLKWHFPGGGRLDLLPAGKPGPVYARRVTQFDWEQLYSELGGHEFIEGLKAQFRASYDYILIDSRTGINETAGICTVQMPDDLVICFTLNRQNIEGSAQVAESVEAQRRLDSGLRILPVPTRVELVEREKLEAAREYVAITFTRFLGHMRSEDRSDYWASVEILSIPFYGYVH